MTMRHTLVIVKSAKTVRSCLTSLLLRRGFTTTASRPTCNSDMDGSSDYRHLFAEKGMTDLYVKYRQTLPLKSFELINDYCKKTKTGNDLAVDVGCGPGISSLPLKKYFKTVIGVDVSQSQISNAPTNVPGLSFRVGTAEDLSFIQSSTVDLVTAGVALHWFNLDKFYPELDRILKPGGTFVAYTIGLPIVENKPEVNDYVNHLHFNVLKDFWSDRRRLALEEKLKSLPSPYEGETRFDDSLMRHWTMDHMIGYIATWSGLNSYIKDNPSHDLKGDLRKKFCEICDLDSTTIMEKVFKSESPTHFMIAHKPTTSLH